MMLEKYSLESKEVDGHRLYLTPEGLWVPSVTTVLQYTMANSKKVRLQRWRNRVGHDEAEAIRLAAAARGSALHKIVEDYFNAGEILEAGLNPYWDSISKVIGEFSNSLLIEDAVWHPLGFAGTVDMVGHWNGVPAIIDWKTSDKKKYGDSVHDYRVQVSAYCAAVNRVYEGQVRIGDAVIVTGVPNLKPQVIHLDRYSLMNCWAEFQQRLERYKEEFDFAVRNELEKTD